MELILFIGCVVLLIIMGQKGSELTVTKQKLAEKERLLGEYRAQNKALQEALRAERRKNSGETQESAGQSGTGNAGQAAQSGAERVNQFTPAGAAQTGAENNNQFAQSGTGNADQAAQAVAENVTTAASTVATTVTNLRAANLAEAINETSAKVDDSDFDEENIKPLTAEDVEQITAPPLRQVPPPPARVRKERKPISSGVLLFGIGILLVLTAGAIFATTSWRILPAAGKVAVLLGTVAVFYTGAFIAEKKLNLRNTSITFFILGSTFLAVSNLAAGYFGMYGFYESEKQFVWAVSCLLVAICMVVGRIIYKTRFFALLGYCFLLISTYLFAIYFCSNAAEIVTVMGVMFLGTKVYTTFVESRFEEQFISRLLNPIQYVYNLVVLCFAFFYENGIYTSQPHVPLSMKITLWMLVIINLGFTLWNSYDNEKISVKTAVFACFSILSVGVADRISEFYTIRFAISLLLFVAVEIALRFVKNKEKFGLQVRQIVAGFADALVLAVSLGLLVNSDLSSSILFLIALALVAAGQYAITHFSENNVTSFLSATGFYVAVIYIGVFANLHHNEVVAVPVYSALTLAAAFAGRFIYKKVAVKNENGIKVDWITVCAPLLLLMCLTGSDTGRFFGALALSAYLATYYGRFREIVSNVFLTLAISSAMFFIGEQPFFDVPTEFVAEWWIVINLASVALVGIVWRKYRRIYIYVWMFAIATAFIGEFFSIEDYSYSDSHVIGMLKLVIYLAGVIALFVFSYVKKSRRFLVEAGFAFVMFSVISFVFEAKGIFVIAALFGLAYLVYLHVSGMSVWAFLPMLQLTIVLVSLDMPNIAWLILFAVELLVAYLLHKQWDRGEKKSLADDWINIFAIAPIYVLFITGKDEWIFIAEMMFAVYALSYYRRYFENKNLLFNKILLTVASASVLVAWISQPWIDMPDIISDEWVILGIMGMCIFNMVCVYKHSTDQVWGWITFAAAVISILIQAQEAVSNGRVTDALILGISMMLLLIWAYIAKKKQWFILAGVTLIAQCLYASREFWKSIAWWVYLLVAGAVLIAIAARSEYKKRQDVETEGTERRHLFQDWTL